MDLNFATAWEAISDEIPESDALLCGDTRRSWREFEDRAARIGAALADADLPVATNVGLALYNGPEYSEAQFACFKQRVTPFNVNFRYTAKELHSLLAGADAQALFFDSTLADAIDEIRGDLPDLRLFIQRGGETTPDWAESYEALIAHHDPAPLEPISVLREHNFVRPRCDLCMNGSRCPRARFDGMPAGINEFELNVV